MEEENLEIEKEFDEIKNHYIEESGKEQKSEEKEEHLVFDISLRLTILFVFLLPFIVLFEEMYWEGIILLLVTFMMAFGKIKDGIRNCISKRKKTPKIKQTSRNQDSSLNGIVRATNREKELEQKINRSKKNEQNFYF